ncbi:MAG: pitrilysin family protein [Bacteroidetes bacterium]|nr:pitrilysin family protein [Bacteroidota bacterium]
MSNKSNLVSFVKGIKPSQKTILDNGIRVITNSIPTIQSISLGIWIDTGSQNEEISNNGISHFLEHMVFKGTKKRSAYEIAHSLESIGGYLNAFTSKEHTCYYARFLNSHINIAFDVLADMILQPLFDSKEIEKEKGVVLEELKNMEDDPGDLIQDYFDNIIYPSHPLGMSVIGTKESIKDFSQFKLIDYKSKNYFASKIVVTAAGNLEHQTIVNLAKKYFDNFNLKNQNKISEKSNKYKPTNKVYLKPIQQTHIILGRNSFSATSEKRFSGYVLNTLLGSGMSSRLFQKVREKNGYAYHIYSFLSCLKNSGTFGVYLACDFHKKEKAIDLVKKEFELILKNGFTKKEFNRAKEHLKGSTVLSLESASSQMMRLGSSELYYKKQYSVHEVISKIDSITLEEVEKTASELLQIQKFSEVQINPSLI